MGRTYHFDLPYKILAAYLTYGIQSLKDEGLWEKLPSDMRRKWERAESLEHDVRVSARDLDRIDDGVWSSIAQKLDLEWESQ